MSTKSKTPTAPADVYQLVTDRIIAALEEGQIPWRKCWKSGHFVPQNYVTKHVYQGINALLTALSPYDIPYFMTFMQVKKLGGFIRKGAKSIPIVYWKVVYKDTDGKTITEEQARELTEVNKRMYVRYYSVFNISDIEGITFDIPEIPKNTVNPIDRCEQIIEHMPKRPTLDFRYRNSASYNVLLDRVKMPQMNQFDTREDYYATLFHEVVHSTGHSSRLNREELMAATEFGSMEYSKEELTAEIGAAFLCNFCQIEQPQLIENSHAYIQGWLKELKNDKRLIISAASKAKAAVAFILGE